MVIIMPNMTITPPIIVVIDGISLNIKSANILAPTGSPSVATLTIDAFKYFNA